MSDFLSAITLGQSPSNRCVGLPRRNRLEHVFILGATGSAKTTFLTNYMRQCLKLGEGVIFLDPHGGHQDSAFRSMLQCISDPIVIDFNASRVVGFNPLACPDDTDPSVIVGCAMDALAVGWEGESFTQRPTIERNLSAIIGALVEMRLPLTDAEYLLDHKDASGLRRRAIETVKDPFTRNELKRMHELANDGRRKRDFEQETIGSVNRLSRLFRPPVARAMLSAPNPLDFAAILDEQKVVLANLSGGSKAYESSADLFGRLLTRTVLFHAKRRKKLGTVNLILDEAHRFLSADIPVLLAEVRKYGISLVMAMQWLSQAKDEAIEDALLNGPGCKICFRLRFAEEAEKMARTMVPVDLERPVNTLIKPTVVGHRVIRLKNEADSTNESRTDNNSITESETEGTTETESYSTALAVGVQESESEGRTSAKLQSTGQSSGDSQSATEIAIPKANGDEVITRVTSGSGTQTGASSSQGTSEAVNTSTTKGHNRTEIETVGYALSRLYSRTRAETVGHGITHGTGKSEGFTEALEPIFEDRPSAVHSLQNQLYAAGQMLLSLPTGTAFLNYIGKRGRVATLFSLPLVLTKKLTEIEYAALRDKYLEHATPLTTPDIVSVEEPDLPVDKPNERGATW